MDSRFRDHFRICFCHTASPVHLFKVVTTAEIVHPEMDRKGLTDAPVAAAAGAAARAAGAKAGVGQAAETAAAAAGNQWRHRLQRLWQWRGRGGTTEKARRNPQQGKQPGASAMRPVRPQRTCAETCRSPMTQYRTQNRLLG